MATRRGDTKKELTPLVVILGPTASGKSDWVNSFAKKFNGEVVSADSRQIFKDFSIGTNKEKGKWQKQGKSDRFMVDGINYHLIDFVAPEAYFSVYEYQKMARNVIQDIKNRHFQPFLSGGTGMYIDAVVDNWKLTKESYNEDLRTELSGKSNIELLRRLKKSDPLGAAKIDIHNTARLIRSIEIIELTGKKKGNGPKQGKRLYHTLKIGVFKERKQLYTNINSRVGKMLEEGLIEEVRKLYKKYPKTLSVFFSIGYKELINYIDGEITLDKAKELIQKNTRHYAKRQMTWWRRDKDIVWCGSKNDAEDKIKEFLTSGKN